MGRAGSVSRAEASGWVWMGVGGGWVWVGVGWGYLRPTLLCQLRSHPKKSGVPRSVAGSEASVEDRRFAGTEACLHGWVSLTVEAASARAQRSVALKEAVVHHPSVDGDRQLRDLRGRRSNNGLGQMRMSHPTPNRWMALGMACL